jgi:hypothetical protein
VTSYNILVDFVVRGGYFSPAMFSKCDHTYIYYVGSLLYCRNFLSSAGMNEKVGTQWLSSCKLQYLDLHMIYRWDEGSVSPASFSCRVSITKNWYIVTTKSEWLRAAYLYT